MARVVKQRKNIPYLLIIFAFLFAVSTGFAIYYGTEIEKALQDKDEAVKQLALNELNTATQEVRFESLESDIQTMVRQFYTGTNPNSYTGAGAAATDIVKEGEKIKRVSRNADSITKIIENRNAETQKLINSMYSLANSSLQDANSPAVTAPEIKTIGHFLVIDKILRDLKEIALYNSKAYKRAEKFAIDVAEKDNTLERVKAENREAITQKDKVIKSLEGALETERNKNVDIIASSTKSFEAKLNAAEEEKKELNDKIAKLDAEIARLKKDVDGEKVIVATLRKKLRDKQKEIVNEIDGKILRVVPKQGICYVNIGSKQNAKVGVTYVVYAPNAPRGENNKNKFKAHIRITQVLSPGVSVARVTYKDDPKSVLLAGDEIGNITVKSFRHYNFVVVGKFALAGSSTPSKLGHRKVVDYLKKCGGTIQDTIDYKTDFLVLGDPLSMPVNPGEDAEESAQEAYNRAKLRYQKRQELINKARELGIKILNKNRLLDFTGMDSSIEG